MSSNLLRLMFSWGLLCLIFPKALGDFEIPIVESENPDPEGIRLDPNLDKVIVRENMTVDQLEAAIIRVLGPEDVIIVGIAPETNAVKILKSVTDGKWHLTLTGIFDADLIDSYTLTCSHGISTKFLLLEIEDVNDSPVQILNDPGRLLENPYNEADVPNTTQNITWVEAFDLDKIDQDKLRFDFDYQIGGPDETFYLDPKTGQLFQLLPFNYNVASLHRLRLNVYDSGDIHSASAVITIDVKDLPNLPPEFISIPLGLNVEEGKKGVVGTVKASDGDFGLNWDIEYILEEKHGEGFPLKYFQINEMGEISVIDEIEIDAEYLFLQENSFVFTLEITAKEIPPPEFPGFEAMLRTEQIIVTIQDIDDNPPQVCTSNDADPNSSDCSSLKEYAISIDENFSGTLELNFPFIVRDLDSTYANSQYKIAFSDDTDDRIKRAFRIQPTSSTGTTPVSILTTPEALALLDYEGVGGNFWWEELGDGSVIPISHEINVQITAINVIEPANATARIFLTVKDLNDNFPEFQLLTNGEYVFNVCENTEDGSPLTILEPSVLPTCKGATDTGVLIKVLATDNDISPEFRNIRYTWNSRNNPPVELEPTEGTMILRITPDTKNFDYERFEEESFIIQANDSSSNILPGRTSQVTCVFRILDQNDQIVQLDLGPTSSVSVDEGIRDPGFPILTGIFAVDVDVDPNLELSIDWSASKLLKKDSFGVHQQISPEEIQEEIKDWFGLEITDTSDPHKIVANLVLTEFVINRELTPEGIDRVDLVFAATDLNDTFSDRTVRQGLTIKINDRNDNPPTFEDIEGPPYEVFLQIQETRENEDETPVRREISSFRVRDLDLVNVFRFELVERDCFDFCEEYLELVDLQFNSQTGRAILYRAEGKMIDREETKFFNGMTTDFLNYTLWAYDTDDVHNTTAEIVLIVDDINDELPRWDEFEKTYIVSETEAIGSPIQTFTAKDDDKIDKYGKISYIFEKNIGPDEFQIDINTGELTVVGQFNWTATKSYSLTIVAVDNYRSESSIDSNSVSAIITINIEDENTETPEFLTDNSVVLGEIYETVPEVDVPLNNVNITVKDDDNPEKPNGQFDVKIITVLKDGVPVTGALPFKTGDRLEDANPGPGKIVQIIPTMNFTGEWGTYDITFEAKDKGEGQLTSTKVYKIIILNENINSPVFIYPDPNNATEEITSLNAPLGDLKRWIDDELITLLASDLDDNKTGNGKVGYFIQESSLDDDGYEYFEINEESGQIRVINSFPDNVQFYSLLVKAEDKGEEPRASFATLKLFLLPEKNRDPQFNESFPINITIPENEVGFVYDFPAAFDPDYEFEDIPGLPPIDTVIYYHIVGGSEGAPEYFKVDKILPKLSTVLPLDREFIKKHELVVFASNDKSHPSQVTNPDQIPPGNPTPYVLIKIEVENLWDTFPEFPQVEEGGIISGGFAASNYENDNIMMISVIDRDEFDNVTFSLSPTFIPSDDSLANIAIPFKISQVPNTNLAANLAILFQPQPAMQGHYTFNITATDLGFLSTTAQCKIYMIKATNIVMFKFLDRKEVVELAADRLAIVLSNAFSYRCNIERISTEENAVNSTIVQTHFIDLQTNEPVLAWYIEQQVFIAETYLKLSEGLREISLTLAQDGIGQSQETTSNTNQLTIYILVGGLGILGVILMVLATTCYFNNRSLSRKVRALTATTFGSQQSGLNRSGAVLDLPNTNEFAIEGSNPMWTTDHSTKKASPAFDTESIGSGGSVLIGVEDDDDFKNYKETNETANDPSEDEDIYDYADQTGTNENKNALYQSDSPEEEEEEVQWGNQTEDDLGMPPIGNTGVKRNPLADMFDNDA